jgi:UDP-3-O-[3-hydroxymyristoyl] glucosamine N-acyltransferase
MSTRLADLVERLGGHLKGDGSIVVAGIAPLADATPSQISFLSNVKFRAQAATSQAAALILAPADDAAIGPGYAGARIVTDNPYAYFARAAQHFAALAAPPREPGIHPQASIDPAATVAPTAVIGAHVPAASSGAAPALAPAPACIRT